MNDLSPNRRHAFMAFLGYLAFVVYGSLVPFIYRDIPLDQALQTFASIPYLELGVGSRADWIANLVLYVPMAFLGCAWTTGARRTGIISHLGPFLVFAFCLAVAVAVEFTQIFFAPRTVSINDLLAETLGVLGGIALWMLGRWRIAQLWEAFSTGGRQSLLAAAIVYGLAYVALALFPYDFLISLRELAWKLDSEHHSWLLAGACEGWLHCTAHLIGEAAAIAPLGVLIGLFAPRVRIQRVLLAGIALGIMLEILQLFLASGISQGLSVLTRGAGLALGNLAGHILIRHGPLQLARVVRRSIPYVALPYVLFLAVLGGWFSGHWLTPSEVFARLGHVRLMPFYYHYFSTEPVAMASLLAHILMYAPVGLAVWARYAGRSRVAGAVAKSALWAALLALPIELGKLIVASKHPDLTNVLIGAGGASVVYGLARWIEHTSVGVSPDLVPKTAPPVARVARSSVAWPKTTPTGALVSILALVATVAGVVSYPVGAGWLTIGLLVYGVWLWRDPSLWMLVVPALLPVLDMSPYTGRLLLDGFDLLVVVTLAVGYWRIFPRPPMPWPSPLLLTAMLLLWTTWVIATTRGLWPALTEKSISIASSHTPWEALLVGKGLLWALLLAPLIRRVQPPERNRVQRRVMNGLVAGLAMVALVVLWERHVFVGIGDFENVFRVTGTFSSMNTGGAYIEAFIAFAFPLLVVWELVQRDWGLKLVGLVILGGTIYAMLVTFSRGGYAGLVVGLVVVIFGTLRQRSSSLLRSGAAVVGVAVAVIAIAVPVLSGGFAQQRLARIGVDMSIRMDHWADALVLMDDGVVATLGGMGFGQYPSLYLWRADVPEPPGTFNVQDDGGNPYVRLGAGEAIYLDQVVDVDPGLQYTLTARVRRTADEGALVIPVCEKALLYSFECIWHQLQPAAPRGEWDTVALQFESDNLGGGGHWPFRPVKLSLFNPGAAGAIDVDDVSLKTADGGELLANGDFAHGLARWLFITDRDPAWHIDQQALEVYFAQGVLGLTALALLLIAVARYLGPALWNGDPFATAFAGALVAFLTVGLLGSTMDTARLSMLFYLGAFYAAILCRAGARELL